MTGDYTAHQAGCSSKKLPRHLHEASPPICMCVYIYTCVYVCMYLCVFTFTYTENYINTSTHYTYICVYIHVEICICICIYHTPPPPSQCCSLRVCKRRYLLDQLAKQLMEEEKALTLEACSKLGHKTVWELPKVGGPNMGGPCNKSHNIFRSIFGPSIYGNSHMSQMNRNYSWLSRPVWELCTIVKLLQIQKVGAWM